MTSSARWFLLVLAAFLGVLCLSAPPASAQTTVWSATLTVKSIGGGVGCSTGNTVGQRCPSALTDNTFTYKGVDYTIEKLQDLNNGVLSFSVVPAASSAALQDLTLVIGSARYDLSGFSFQLTLGLFARLNTNLNWSVGDTVSLSFEGPPTIAFDEYTYVTEETEQIPLSIAVVLSEALATATTVGIEIGSQSRATEPDDVTLSTKELAFAAGETSKTFTVSTVADMTTEGNENLVLRLVAVQNAPYVLGNPSSIEVVILDDSYTPFSSWQATLSPAGPSSYSGCLHAGYKAGSRPCTEALTDDDFELNGVRYTISQVTLRPGFEGKSGYLELVFGGVSKSACDGGGNFPLEGLTLYVGEGANKRAFRLSDGDRRLVGDGDDEDVGDDGCEVSWYVGSDLPWTGSQGVSLSLRRTEDTTTPTTQTLNTGGGGPPTGGGGPPTGGGGPPTGGGGPPTGGGGTPTGDTTPPDGGSGTPPPGEPSDTRCGASDRENLESFYKASGGEDWYEKENWNSREPLDQWYGVETDDAGEVVSLRLADNGLSGDMPTKELLCLSELKELALWDNDDLSGEVPEELVLAVERAVLRDIAEMLDLNPEWFEDYEDPFNFEDWHTGVTTDDEGRVTELDLTGEGVIGEIPESVSELQRLREIMITTSSEDGGCALSAEGSSAFGLFLLTLVVFAVLGRKRAQ